MEKKLARDVMTSDPACCTIDTTLDEVARLMIQHDCGEIPVIDRAEHPVGVVTDRDIVCRVVAEGKNPIGYTAESCMTTPVVTVRTDTSLDDVVSTMERHKIRRVPVVDERGVCAGIVSQADVARALEVARALQGDKPHSSLTGQSLLLEARIQATVGEDATARQTAKQAVAHLAETLAADHPDTRRAREGTQG